MVEFKDVASINEVMSSASFINKNCIAPIKSSVLWFRKGQLNTSKKNNWKKVPLFVENGCTLPTNQEIAKLLHNAKSVGFFNIFMLRLGLI